MTDTPSSKPTPPGVNVLLMGPSGTGKTHSIGTLVDTGLQTHYLAFEAGVESLLGYWTDLSDLASLYAWLSAAFMLSVVYAGRYAMLKSFRHSLTSSLTWIAPRGLITVVLFLGANNAMSLPRFLNGTIVLVVLVSAALVAVGQYHARAAGITSAAESDSESGTP